MLRYTAMSNYQAFRWLLRFDSEAKLFWLWAFLLQANLSECVGDNLYPYARGAQAIL
jgi:hypothetical protein